MFEDDSRENQFDKLKIGIASDTVIRDKWSRGEIKKPETINYRTFKPKRVGSFAKRSLVPQKIGSVHAVNIKKSNTKDIVCDRCGVEVTLSKVRRERMAHIEWLSLLSISGSLKPCPHVLAMC